MKKLDRTYILYIILFLLCLAGSVKGQTLDSVKRHLMYTDLKHKDIVLKQAILETGHFKSYSCRVRHNLFGFRYKGKYLEFDTWQESVNYMIWFQGSKLRDGEDYYDFLERIGYATDPDYIKKLKQIKI